VNPATIGGGGREGDDFLLECQARPPNGESTDGRTELLLHNAPTVYNDAWASVAGQHNRAAGAMLKITDIHREESPVEQSTS